MNTHFQDMLREATRLTQNGQLREATQLIQGALSMPGNVDRPTPGNVDRPMPGNVDRPVCEQPTGTSILDSSGIEIAVLADLATSVSDGTFTTASHANATLKRNYKLYIPPNHAGTRRPLIVMLHGCTQDSSDFAAGTGMNERARQQGFFVLYPEQSSAANPSRCWNWFKQNHQRRGSGEPELLADMTRAIIKQFDIDTSRIFIAGLSAGGAMAAIVADAYPDIFSAAGVHSGLPAGAAQNVAGALAAMKSGEPDLSFNRKLRSDRSRPVPTIVFHGDQDSTVHPRNGEQVIKAAVSGFADEAARADSSMPGPRIETGQSGKGRRYTRSIHLDKSGEARAEHWLIHGAGHAWSGGQSQGSFTDPGGPDATDEMLRFFLAQPEGKAR